MRFTPTITLALSASLAVLGSRTLPAQSAALATVPAAATASLSSPSTGRALGGAILGGAGGLLLGGITGLYVGGGRCSEAGNPDACKEFYGLLIGAGVGLTLGIPVGAHLLNRRQGSLPYSLLASAALAAVGAVALQSVEGSTDWEHRDNVRGTVVIGVPILQIVSTTLIESLTSRR
jgi:hypothetical protein